MAKTIYTTRKGEKVALRPSDVKSYVMKVRGWTSQEYEKQYDKLRNRLRGYEAYQRQAGIDVNVQSPAHILYYESKSMKKYGAAYEQSNEMKRLLSFPSISTGKALQKTLEDEKSLRSLTLFMKLQQMSNLKDLLMLMIQQKELLKAFQIL